MAHKIISLEEAIRLIKENEHPKNRLSVSLTDALGMVLSEDIKSTISVPPFNKSAMDGYALRADDLTKPLKVKQTIAAGNRPGFAIEAGCCARIFTGAPVPENADMVVMQEYVEVIDKNTIRFKNEKSNTNICLKGEDLMPGDTVLSAGTLLRSEHIAMLASVGTNSINIWQKPKIGIMATGNELVEPGQPLGEGEIYNANGHQLTARLMQLGFDTTYLGIANDTVEGLNQKLLHATSTFDVVILTGGVSVGDYDLVPFVLNRLGFDTHITTISTKPGKHTLYATTNNCSVLGLPGNPVSTFIQMEVCGLPLIYKKMGFDFNPLRIKCRVADTFKRKKEDRFELLPILINNDGEASRVPYHGSAHINAIGFSNALLEIPIGTKEIKAGDEAYVRPLQ